MAGTPYIVSPETFSAGQVVLNTSLRDLSPNIILKSWNVVDDIDHCLKADTSPHLAEKMAGHRDFTHGTLAQCILKEIVPDTHKPAIFSPFGLGVLDLAVGEMVYDQATVSEDHIPVDDFFNEQKRWA